MVRGRKAEIKTIVEIKYPRGQEKKIIMGTPQNVKCIIRDTNAYVFRFLNVTKKEIAIIESMHSEDEKSLQMGFFLDNCIETIKLGPKSTQQLPEFSKFHGISPQREMDKE